ncbi:MAG: glycosyltransferase family 4 protein [Candidatus Woesearchaeota archaeon]
MKKPQYKRTKQKNRDGMKIAYLPNNNTYINTLMKEMEKLEIKSSGFPSMHYATPYNFLKALWLRVTGYRIFHFHWLYCFPFSWLMKSFITYLKILGYRTVWTVHNVLPLDCTAKDIEKTRWFHNHMDWEIVHFKNTISEMEKEIGIDVNPSKVSLIPHAILNLYPNNVSKDKARQWLGIKKNKKVLLCFGMMRSNRGYDYFINALKKLPKDYVGLIVGRPEEKKLAENLKKEAEKLENLRVVAEFVPDKDLQIYFKAADAVVLPYTRITTSGVVCLAAFFSRPVIVSNLGGMSEIVKPSFGNLTKPGDTEDLIKNIKNLLKKNHETMGKKFKNDFKSRYSWDNVIRKTKRTYEKILKDER